MCLTCRVFARELIGQVDRFIPILAGNRLIAKRLGYRPAKFQEQADSMDAATADVTHKPVAAWGAVLSMALCVAMLIASEFMPVSLLTPMAAGLGATEGQTGQAISVSGLFAVVASLLITTAAGKLNRK